MSWQRLAVLRGQLTERNWAMMAMLAAVKLANGNQLRRATLGDDSPAAERAARRQLARLVECRVVERLERRQGGLRRRSRPGSTAVPYTRCCPGRTPLHVVR